MSEQIKTRCENCGRIVGFGTHTCPSDYGFLKAPPVRHGPDHPQWKGDAAREGTKRARARRAYPLGKCERCERTAVDRHHIDGNTGNNAPENIARLCRRCHYAADGRIDAMRVRMAALAAEKAARPACIRGHAFTPETTYREADGSRRCRVCARDLRRASRARQ